MAVVIEYLMNRKVHLGNVTLNGHDNDAVGASMFSEWLVKLDMLSTYVN